MARDDQSPPDPRVTRSMRRDQPSTDRLGQGAPASSDPLNPNWRSDRAGSRPRRQQSMPFTRQEFALWLQYGGWRFILAAAAIVVVGAALFILSQNPPTPLPQAEDTPADGLPAVVPTTLPSFATITPAVATAGPTAPPQPATGQQLRVTGTGAEGLFLRSEPNTNNQPLKTLPESSVVTVVGEPSTVDGRTWLRVRDEAGSEGWAASDFLKPVQ